MTESNSIAVINTMIDAYQQKIDELEVERMALAMSEYMLRKELTAATDTYLKRRRCRLAFRWDKNR